ncbi:MAG: 23S rRNA (uracil(1939)-C(5))-methyltransferase RlmD [Pseudomonadota bacterium]
MQPTRIESLDQEGRGIAHADGKVIFVNGALPGELVTYAPYLKKPKYELAQVQQVLRPSFARTEPRCRHYGICGGCSIQHLDARAQVAVKQRVLEDSLRHIGKIRPDCILPAIYGAPWGYRHRARFSARYVPNKGGALIGFREKRSSHVADMTTCEVVPPRIAALLVPLRALVNALSIPDRLPQVELAIGDGVDALVVRNLQPLASGDEELLRQFADRYRVQFFLQPRGPDSARPFYPAHDGVLYYSLPEFGLNIGFSPTEFTQVNPGVNALLVRRAVALLEPQAGERIADMFCGLGNFSLAIARGGAGVVGFEGSRSLVARARSNAELNGLSAAAEFVQADLFKLDRAGLSRLGRFDRMLVDPPRDGAVELIKTFADDAPRRIVYISCNPATLARDAGVLAHTKGYGLSAAGVVNMFPHTSHVESIAVFDRQ